MCMCFVCSPQQAVAFTGLQGKTLYPAVQFYSSNREVSLVKVEASTGATVSMLTSFPCVESLCEANDLAGAGTAFAS